MLSGGTTSTIKYASECIGSTVLTSRCGGLQDDEAAEISRKVLQAVKLMGWQLGKTRVFLRAGQLAQLEVSLLP